MVIHIILYIVRHAIARRSYSIHAEHYYDAYKLLPNDTVVKGGDQEVESTGWSQEVLPSQLLSLSLPPPSLPHVHQESVEVSYAASNV